MKKQNFIPYIEILVSFILGVSTTLVTNAYNKKINAKEYEISENFKSEFLEMVLSLYSIKDKIEYEEPKDISAECEKLTELRLKPGYLLMMLSFKNEGEIVKFDNRLQEIIELKQYAGQIDPDIKENNIVKIKQMFETLFNNIDNFVVNAKFENLSQIKKFIRPNIDIDK